MMLLRHNKCDNSVNKYDSLSDENNDYDASDDDSLPSLYSDSDLDDMEQHEVGDLELHLTYEKIEDDDPIPQDETEVGDAGHMSFGKPCKFWQTTLCCALMEFVSSSASS
jgi:hypothetical protein